MALRPLREKIFYLSPASLEARRLRENKRFFDRQIVDEWIDIYNNDGMPTPPATAGKKYSGKFHLRIDSELHQALAIRAMQNCAYRIISVRHSSEFDRQFDNGEVLVSKLSL